MFTEGYHSSEVFDVKGDIRGVLRGMLVVLKEAPGVNGQGGLEGALGLNCRREGEGRAEGMDCKVRCRP